MSVLDELVDGTLKNMREREKNLPFEHLKELAKACEYNPIDVYSRLKKDDSVAIIAEIKRASPSKGHLSDIPDPAALAREYETGGASVISVLTEH